MTSSRRSKDRVDVELAGRGLRRARDAARLVERLRGAEQRLRRHARVVGALAADEMVLDDRDREAVLAEAAGAHLAGRAGADHDDVELGHQSGSVRALDVVRVQHLDRVGEIRAR